LDSVFAYDFVKGPMEKVRDGVVALDCVTAFFININVNWLATFGDKTFAQIP
jgi:hypothetical protein